VKDKAEKLLETAINRLGLSARAYSRVLNIGCTIADSHTAEPFSTEPWTGECGHAPGRFDVYLKSDESQFRWARLSQLLRSSLVSRHRQPRGESWKARASEPKGCVQAPRTVGITAPGVDRVVADKAEAYCPRLEGLGPWFLRSRNCLNTYELLNKSRSSAETFAQMEIESSLVS
jgi:hypothetical protein